MKTKDKTRAKSKAKAPASYTDDWNVVDDLRVEVEDPSKVHRRGKMIRRAILTAPILAVLSLGISASMNSTIADINTSIEEMTREVQIDSPGKAQALLAMNAWLSSENKPLPSGYVLSWDKREVLADYEIKIDEETQEQKEILGREVHHFTLANGSGLLYSSTVTTTWAPIRGAVALGDPTLMPLPPTANETVRGATWMNLAAGTASEHAKTAVESWAAAYTSGDPAKLRQVVGDPVATNSYMPMIKIASATAVVGEAGISPELEAEDRMIVRATLAVKWAGQKYEGSDSSVPTLEYDLLLEKVSTASPVVVAWTSAGLGEQLKPYSNAVSGLDIKVDQDIVSVAVNTAGEGAE